MKSRMKLDNLKVESFITENTNEVKGGTISILTGPITTSIVVSQVICPSAYDNCPSAVSGCFETTIINPLPGYGG